MKLMGKFMTIYEMTAIFPILCSVRKAELLFHFWYSSAFCTIITICIIKTFPSPFPDPNLLKHMDSHEFTLESSTDKTIHRYQAEKPNNTAESRKAKDHTKQEISNSERKERVQKWKRLKKLLLLSMPHLSITPPFHATSDATCLDSHLLFLHISASLLLTDSISLCPQFFMTSPLCDCFLGPHFSVPIHLSMFPNFSVIYPSSSRTPETKEPPVCLWNCQKKKTGTPCFVSLSSLKI